MSCHFPLFPIYLHKPIQSRVAALAQEYTLDCRLVDYYNLEPKLWTFVNAQTYKYLPTSDPVAFWSTAIGYSW